MKLTHEQVMEILPHRDPMLLIDEVQELIPGQSVIATFCPDPSREIFKGHYPHQPMLPGIYTIETTAQAAVLVLGSKPEYVGKLPLLIGVDHVRLCRKIFPGETLEIHAEMVRERPEKALGVCTCQVYVCGELAAESEIVIAMR